MKMFNFTKKSFLFYLIRITDEVILFQCGQEAG